MRLQLRIVGASGNRVTPIADPTPYWGIVILEAFQSEEGVNLIRMSDNGDFLGDTWHKDLASAEEQIRDDYEVTDIEWVAVEDELDS